MVGSPLNPDSSYSNAEEVVVAAWWVYDDQGSGELDRAGAKGSSNGFSSKAREDCCKRSSKPDMTALLHSRLRQTERACTFYFPTAIISTPQSQAVTVGTQMDLNEKHISPPLPRHSLRVASALSLFAGLSSTAAIRCASGEGSCLRAMSRNQSLPI